MRGAKAGPAGGLLNERAAASEGRLGQFAAFRDASTRKKIGRSNPRETHL
jgi:hypothetical protein